MRRAARRRAQRGSTLIEVMVATVILILAAAGFAGTSQYASTSTGIGHRRTVGTLLRAGLIDRLHVTDRTALRTLAASNEDVWILDGCWDVDSQRLAANTGWVATFTCPADTQYQSWINVSDNGKDPWAATTNTWRVSLYVERVSQGCTPENREGSAGCVSADILLTD